MRYAEKSFEVRFCAALTAAVMPLNRNPKWFGLTQAQERQAGIDTILGIGGTLVIFQFKAKQSNKIKIDREQYQKLRNVENTYPNSTFYVFPEAGDIFAAGAENCLFEHAFCCPPSRFDAAFPNSENSAAFTLDVGSSYLAKKRPAQTLHIKSACERLGCFCPSSAHDIMAAHTGRGGSLIQFLTQGWQDGTADVVPPPFTDNSPGIPIGQTPDERADSGNPIRSAEAFERLLGEDAFKDLNRGLYGLFFSN